MVLLRKNYKPDGISRVWDAAKRFGSFLFVAGFLMGNKGSCLSEEKEVKSEPKVVERTIEIPSVDVSGEYICKGKLVKNKGADPRAFKGRSRLSFTKKGEKGFKIKRKSAYLASTYDTSDLKAEEGKLSFTSKIRIPIFGLTEISYDYKVEGITKSDGTLEFDEVFVLKGRGFAQGIGGEFTLHQVCEPIGIRCDNYKRAVFIRPCPGQLFNSDFTGTLVGGGTVQSVCEDLRQSCVTDLFIPFKAAEVPPNEEKKIPGENDKGCGVNGELSYPSGNYPDHVNERFRKMHEQKGQDGRIKDPVRDLIEACSALGINVHASFAVFKDPKAIEVAGGAEKAGAKAIIQKEVPEWKDDSLGWFTTSFSNLIDSATAWVGDYDYASDIFADPENEGVINYQITLLREIMGRYEELDGINLDYVRYGGIQDLPEDKRDTMGWIVKPEAIEAFVRRVREEFPGVTLTADVFAGNRTRIGFGQNGIIPYLKYSILMQYSDTDPDEIGVVDEVKKYTDEFKANHPGREFLSLLRGWRCKKAWCNIDENRTDKKDGFKVNLKADIGSAKRSGANGYGVFTYENLLADTDTKKLRDLRNDIDF